MHAVAAKIGRREEKMCGEFILDRQPPFFGIQIAAILPLQCARMVSRFAAAKPGEVGDFLFESRSKRGRLN